MLITYLITIFFALIIAMAYDLRKVKIKADEFLLLFILPLIIFNTITREIIPYSDTDVYLYNFQHISSIFETSEFVFNSLMLISKCISENFRVFLAIIASIYYACVYYSIKKYTKYYNTSLFLGLFIFISMFFNYSLSMNVLRQGLAVGFLLVIIGILHNLSNNINYKVKSLILILILLALFSHHSSLVFIAVVFVVALFKKVKMRYYYALFISAILISYVNRNDIFGLSYILSGLGDSSNYSKYGQNQLDYEIGFKIKFILFNLSILILSVRLYKSKLQENLKYLMILKSFIVLSSIFFILSSIPFSDRIGLYSWILIPYLMMPYLSYSYNHIKTLIVILLGIVYFIFNSQLY